MIKTLPGFFVPPPRPVSTTSMTTVIKAVTLRPCYCTGACRTLGYCPVNPPAKPPALRADEV